MFFMETLKFLMTTDTYPPYAFGGDAIAVRYLAEELARRGHEVHIIHSLDIYAFKEKKYIQNKEENTENVYTHPVKSPLRIFDPLLVYALGSSPFVYKRYKEIQKEVSPDVVHHHNISSLGYNLLKKLGNYISLYTAHSYWLICSNQRLITHNGSFCDKKACFSCANRSKRPPQLWRSKKDFKNSINDIDAIIAPSNFMKNKLAEELDVKIEHIPNFVPYPPQEIRDSGYSNYFLYAGVLERHKGILDLLEVFKRYSDEIDAKLIIVGSGPLEKQIKEFINKHNLQNKIIFLGFVDREVLWSLYKDALAIVMPSIWSENNPLVALEAISVGTPVIGSDQGGIPEIVEKVDKRLIFRAGDLEGMKRVLVEYDRAKYSVEKVKAVYEKWYSVERYINEYYRLINGL